MTPRGKSGTRRWFIAIEPIIESGRRGAQAQQWAVEDELEAVAVFGDVTLDLSGTKSLPKDVVINAYALLRDVDIFVGPETRVELDGGVLRGSLCNEVPEVSESECRHILRVHGHSLLGDVTVRLSQAA